MFILLLYEIRTLLGYLAELHEKLKLLAGSHLATVVHVVKFLPLRDQLRLTQGLSLNVLVGHQHLLVGLSQEILQVGNILVYFSLLS